MHLKKFKIKINRKKAVPVIVIAAVVLSVGIVVSVKSASAKTDDTPTVQTENVTVQDLTKSITLSGKIVSAATYPVSAPLSDVIVKNVNVKVGDRVNKGDVIAVLDGSSIEASLKGAEESLSVEKEKQQLELKQAQRALNEAQETAALQAARAAADTANAMKQYNDAVNENGSWQSSLAGSNSAVSNENDAYNSAKADVDEATKKSRKTEKALSDAQNYADQAKTSLSEKESALSIAKDAEKAAEEAVNEAKNEEEKKKAEADLVSKRAAREQAEREYNSAKAEASTAESELEEATEKNNKAKYKLEDKQSDLSNEESKLSEAKSKQSEAESSVKSTKDSVESTKESAIKAAQAEQDTNRTNEKAVLDSKDGLRNAELNSRTSLISAETEVEKYKKQMTYLTVSAPSAGIITSVSVKEGDNYTGGEIAVVQDDSGFKVSASVDQYDISDVAPGMKAIIKTNTTGDEEMEGELTFVSPITAADTVKADNSSSTQSSSTSSGGDYPIEITIKNPSERLRMGMTAKITLIENESKGTLAVPGNCIQADENGNDYVTVQNGDITENVPVKKGLVTDYYTEISGNGISEGTQIVMPDAYGDTETAGGVTDEFY